MTGDRLFDRSFVRSFVLESCGDKKWDGSAEATD